MLLLDALLFHELMILLRILAIFLLLDLLPRLALAARAAGGRLGNLGWRLGTASLLRRSAARTGAAGVNDVDAELALDLAETDLFGVKMVCQCDEILGWK